MKGKAPKSVAKSNSQFRSHQETDMGDGNGTMTERDSFGPKRRTSKTGIRYTRTSK